jgi:hypothetical protein
MMDETSKPARWAAIEILQKRREQYGPGSGNERIAERATDLILRDARAVGAPCHLANDAWRNAAYAMYRSRAREQVALARYAAANLILVRAEDGDDIVDLVSVEDSVLAHNSPLCACALQSAAALGTFGPAFVRRLMAGDTITEAAAATGISRASGYRAATRLRHLLAEVRPVALAAS